jgi:hypothetical protein
MDIMVFTESTVWLAGQTASKGSWGSEPATENLDQLVLLADAITRSGQDRFVDAWLTVEGSPFLNHEARLKAAFAKITEYGKRE